jgi:GTP-binding protein LepA
LAAKCYGDDVTRKGQPPEKPNGMPQFGKVDIPQEALIAALKVDV